MQSVQCDKCGAHVTLDASSPARDVSCSVCGVRIALDGASAASGSGQMAGEVALEAEVGRPNHLTGNVPDDTSTGPTPSIAERDSPANASPTDSNPFFNGLIGVAVAVVFYACAVYPLRNTYFGKLLMARGWVPYAIMLLAFWALVSLVRKRLTIWKQTKALGLDLLPVNIADRITPENSPMFCRYIRSLSIPSSGNFLIDRVYHALRYFTARRKASEVAEHLGMQSQADANAVESSYTLIKVIIWAIPILGFIGTVLGIGTAVSGFSSSVDAAAELPELKSSIGMVTTGLGVAFETTLLALIVSLLVMFPASLMQKAEERLLAAVDNICSEDMLRRLEDGQTDGDDASILRTTIAVEMAKHHGELQAWSKKLVGIGDVLTDRMTDAWKLFQDQQKVHLEEQYQQAGTVLCEMQEGMLTRFKDVMTSEIHVIDVARKQATGQLAEHIAGLKDLHQVMSEHSCQAADIQKKSVETARLLSDQQTELLATQQKNFAESLEAMLNQATEAQHRQVAVMAESQGLLVETARIVRSQDEAMRQGMTDDMAARQEQFARGIEALAGEATKTQEQQLKVLSDASSQVAVIAEQVREQGERVRNDTAAELTALHEQFSSGLTKLEQQALAAHQTELQTVLKATQQISLAMGEQQTQSEAIRDALVGTYRSIESTLGDQAGKIGKEITRPWKKQIAEMQRLYEEISGGTRVFENASKGLSTNLDELNGRIQHLGDVLTQVGGVVGLSDRSYASGEAGQKAKHGILHFFRRG